MAELQAIVDLASRDPFLFYTLLATLFLALVSLGSGWLRSDFIAIVRPQGLLAVVLAVLAGFGLLWLRQTLSQTLSPGAENGLSLEGVSRFPLYVVALAYGPSAGLLAGGLFAAFATSSHLPGLPEAVLALELSVLGWFAISPSPRRYRWAGPLNVLLAYFLTWATAGSAMLQYLTANGTSWATQASYHQQTVGGLLLSAALLFALGPGLYRRLFPGSRIAPAEARASDLSRERPASGLERQDPEAAAKDEALQPPLFPEEARSPLERR